MKDKGQLQAGRESVERGRTRSAKTERERACLAAVGRLYSDFKSTPQRARLIAYRDAMQEVAAKYPDEHEAQIFYALAIAASEDPSDKSYDGRLMAGAILEKLFEAEPTHPGLAHYIIHTYDVPALAGRALVAARRYSEIAPDAQTAQKPILENDGVTVWEFTDSAPARELDAVVVSYSGSAAFLSRGVLPKISGRSIVIDLKDHPVTPLQNVSGYPLAFPRRGVTKILENERVIVWDCT